GLTVGPRWLFPTIVGLLLLATLILHRAERHALDRVFGFTLTTLITVQMIVSLGLLVSALPGRRETPTALLVSAASLWCTNIVVFALWYWRLDAGGPHGREARPGQDDGAFLFPQMALPPESRTALNLDDWSPNFLSTTCSSRSTPARRSHRRTRPP